MKFILDEKLDRRTWKHYLLQSTLAAVSLFFALMSPFIQELVLVAAIGSTAFIVFAMPYNHTAKPRNVIGGHFACALLGLLFSNLITYIPTMAVISIGVGVAILVMVSLDIEHPPAGGTIIFFIMTPLIEPLIALLFLASLMTLISLLLKPYMMDLI
ncbi:MAG: HPP family protein [Thermoplasmatota archaeon]